MDPPQFNKFGPVDYYNDNISSHNRPNGGWFEHYNIGINGSAVSTTLPCRTGARSTRLVAAPLHSEPHRV